ncbi:hypothetical protein [Alkalihalobacillus sp. AL-G]|uniref:hypothetical protein n=1 Tax=Alkalihalobacillus sp. AL-G TaxID=2926399 RepID=UPI00272A671A|nr:hypothetical protein [Alkalihalobacillus sp. AL-G]WLD93494.1 hypothetical protein MOJ78_00675 [Alkalihalobacillus sp. AL-G]
MKRIQIRFILFLYWNKKSPQGLKRFIEFEGWEERRGQGNKGATTGASADEAEI